MIEVNVVHVLEVAPVADDVLLSVVDVLDVNEPVARILTGIFQA